MEIPVNKNNNEREHVETMINALLKDYRFPTFAGCSCASYGKEECKKVLDAFKEKGFFCYYLERFDGKWIELQIYANEYQPSNRGYNHLYRY